MDRTVQAVGTNRFWWKVIFFREKIKQGLFVLYNGTDLVGGCKCKIISHRRMRISDQPWSHTE
jgi:hypothetical protein